jgi:hypothetical protein
MKSYSLKLSFTSLFFVLVIFYGSTGDKARASSSGPPASHTSAPGEQNCAISGCHTSQVNGGSGTLTLSGLPEIGYVINERYDVTVTLRQVGQKAFGFELTCLTIKGARRASSMCWSRRAQKSCQALSAGINASISLTY